MSSVSLSLAEARQLYELLQRIDSQVDDLTIGKKAPIGQARDDLQDLQSAITTLLGLLRRMNLPEDVLMAVRRLQTLMAVMRGMMAMMAAMEIMATGGLSPFGWMRLAATVTAGGAMMVTSVANQMEWEMESRRRR